MCLVMSKPILPPKCAEPGSVESGREESEKQKQLEPPERKGGADKSQPAGSASVFAGISSRVPALLEAHKLSARAAHVGLTGPK